MEDYQLESLLTSHLPLLQSGTLNQDAGTIEGLSGSASASLSFNALKTDRFVSFSQSNGDCRSLVNLSNDPLFLSSGGRNVT